MQVLPFERLNIGKVDLGIEQRTFMNFVKYYYWEDFLEEGTACQLISQSELGENGRTRVITVSVLLHYLTLFWPLNRVNLAEESKKDACGKHQKVLFSF